MSDTLTNSTKKLENECGNNSSRDNSSEVTVLSEKALLESTRYYRIITMSQVAKTLSGSRSKRTRKI